MGHFKIYLLIMIGLVATASKQDKAYALNTHDYFIINHFNDYIQNCEM